MDEIDIKSCQQPIVNVIFDFTREIFFYTETLFKVLYFFLDFPQKLIFIK